MHTSPKRSRAPVRRSLPPANTHRDRYGTATVHGPLSQRTFLLHMGIGTRVGALQRAAASPERADALGKAAVRLVDAAGMGREYKVMGVTGGIKDKDTGEGVWPFVAGEVQDAPTDGKEGIDRATAA